MTFSKFMPSLRHPFLMPNVVKQALPSSGCNEALKGHVCLAYMALLVAGSDTAVTPSLGRHPVPS